MRPYLIVGNWKMNPETLAGATKLAKQTLAKAAKLKKTSVVYCPSATFLAPLAKLKKKEVLLGAQNVFYEKSGAFTGEISPTMLKSLGIGYCIVGHSERRSMGETNEDTAKKVTALLAAGIRPILCIGERARDPEGWHLSGVRDQLEAVISVMPKQKITQLVIAYEPVWAIGKNAAREATPDECREMVIFIRKVLSDFVGAATAQKVTILYGGSVDATNGAFFIREGGVSGLLPGRLSLDAVQFGKLLEAVDVL